MSVFRDRDVNTVVLSLLDSQAIGINVTAEEVIITLRMLAVFEADVSRDDSISSGGWTMSRR